MIDTHPYPARSSALRIFTPTSLSLAGYQLPAEVLSYKVFDSNGHVILYVRSFTSCESLQGLG